MGEQNLERAVRVLEPLELTPETEAQWMELSELALANNQVGAREVAGTLRGGTLCGLSVDVPLANNRSVTGRGQECTVTSSDQ